MKFIRFTTTPTHGTVLELRGQSYVMVGTKRYLRVVATGTAGTDAAIAGVWILQKPRYSPKGDAAANIAAT